MLETFGSIIKEEEIITIEKGILTNTFVLENLGSFPGYYDTNFTSQEKPDTFFLVTSKEYSAEAVFRMTHEIKKKTGIKFDGSPASINMDNKVYFAIRVKFIEGFESIAELQKYYADHGVVYARSRKLEGVAVIQIQKIYKITQLKDDIYKDEVCDMYYLKIDRLLNWEDFKKITNQVRNNLSVSAFDAALAVIYGFEVHDMIRIYSKTISVEELEMLHEKYREIIQKYF